MKATPSNAEKRNLTRSNVLQVPIAIWEEDTFSVPVAAPPALCHTPEDLSAWENIEAIGAADDPARFKADLGMPELDCLHS